MQALALRSFVSLLFPYGTLAFGLDFYADVLDPQRLLPLLLRREGDTAFGRRHAKLNEAVAELVEDFSLVSFGTLDISDKASVRRALRSIDKANGYCFGDVEGADAGILTVAAGDPDWDAERLGDVQERYMRERSSDDGLGGSDDDELLADQVRERYMREDDLHELCEPCAPEGAELCDRAGGGGGEG